MSKDKASCSKLRFRFFGHAECKELQSLKAADEQVFMAAYGYYAGGSGLLAVTDSRVLLIDKQPFYVHLEDVCYEHITAVQLKAGLLQSTLTITTGSKKVQFKSLSDASLKQMYYYVLARSELKSDHVEQLISAYERQFAPVQSLKPKLLLTSPQALKLSRRHVYERLINKVVQLQPRVMSAR